MIACDTVYSEQFFAVVVLRDGHRIDAGELRSEHCKGLIAGYRGPAQRRTSIDELPLSSALRSFLKARPAPEPGGNPPAIDHDGCGDHRRDRRPGRRTTSARPPGTRSPATRPSSSPRGGFNAVRMDDIAAATRSPRARCTATSGTTGSHLSEIVNSSQQRYLPAELDAKPATRRTSEHGRNINHAAARLAAASLDAHFAVLWQREVALPRRRRPLAPDSARSSTAWRSGSKPAARTGPHAEITAWVLLAVLQAGHHDLDARPRYDHHMLVDACLAIARRATGAGGVHCDPWSPPAPGHGKRVPPRKRSWTPPRVPAIRYPSVGINDIFPPQASPDRRSTATSTPSPTSSSALVARFQGGPHYTRAHRALRAADPADPTDVLQRLVRSLRRSSGRRLRTSSP
ncbi:hypothetical protein HBB16_20135 [Pseudonocardia sp. MCCB 268]|nr:hypothetical protein [Pseudonocardia cytotoxica]